MSRNDVELLQRGWEAFGRGDVDAAVAVLDPRVRWYAVGDPDGEGSCYDREEASAFLRRALAEGMTAESLDVCDAGDRLIAVIQRHAPAEWNRSPEPHGELVRVRDGKVAEMVVYPTVEDALAAAGLAATTNPPASR